MESLFVVLASADGKPGHPLLPSWAFLDSSSSASSLPRGTSKVYKVKMISPSTRKKAIEEELKRVLEPIEDEKIQEEMAKAKHEKEPDADKDKPQG